MDEKLEKAYECYVAERKTEFTMHPMVVCRVDPDTRKIAIPADARIAGVMADNNTRRIYFSLPRIVYETDLSTFEVHINYMNANGEADRYICIDKTFNDSELCVSWLIGSFATKYQGDVRFVICFTKNTGEHWNTAVGCVKVLEGLETSETIEVQNPDIIEEILKKINDVSERIEKVEKPEPIEKEEIDSLFQERKVL